MLTDNDINRLKKVFATKDEVREIVHEVVDEKLKLFPTKDEYFSRMDKLSGEIQAIRVSQELHANEHSRVNDRLDRLEKHTKLPPLE